MCVKGTVIWYLYTLGVLMRTLPPVPCLPSARDCSVLLSSSSSERGQRMNSICRLYLIFTVRYYCKHVSASVPTNVHVSITLTLIIKKQCPTANKNECTHVCTCVYVYEYGNTRMHCTCTCISTLVPWSGHNCQRNRRKLSVRLRDYVIFLVGMLLQSHVHSIIGKL